MFMQYNFYIFRGDFLLWANPLKRELCPVSALFMRLLVPGLFDN